MTRARTRRTQSVVPFGVGSIVEFEDEALMAAGLDVWPSGAERLTDEERLASRLGVDHFRVPPPAPGRKGQNQPTGPLPYVRFPQWHFCSWCRRLKRADLYDPHPLRCDNADRPRPGGRPPCAAAPPTRRPVMVPLRFIAVCAAGHIEDFPWNAWAHSKRGGDIVRDVGCHPENLYFFATKAGGLSGLQVQCMTCGAKRSLLGATSNAGLRGFRCQGARPWLGKEGAEPCREATGPLESSVMMAVQRGASNVYFPEVASSILIPPYSSEIRRVLTDRRVREILGVSLNDGKISDAVLATIAALKGVKLEELRAGLEAVRTGQGPALPTATSDEAEFRVAEFRALTQERRSPKDLLGCLPQDIAAYGGLIRECFDRVTLVERLVETRALTGFRRLDPSAGALARLAKGQVNWLPAFRVRGEGVFMSLRPSRLASYRASYGGDRVARLMERAGRSDRPGLACSKEVVLLHTLAHLLIKRLSYEAGYGASSIRERLYATPAGADTSTVGLLLYTAAGDADGTLGGLVHLGRPHHLDRIMAGAIEDARWCGADPICSESGGQGPGSLNLAACHACALLPETSCEMQNCFLDRRSVLAYVDG